MVSRGNLCNINDAWTGKAWYPWKIRVYVPKRTGKSDQSFLKQKRLFWLSIVFLVVQSDCCHFREHEHSPTTWDIRSINGFFLLCSMSSTFNPRLSQISFSMPTAKVDNLFAFTKLQMLRERETIGWLKATSSWTTLWSWECKDSASNAFCCSSSSLSGFSSERGSRTPPEMKEHLFLEKGELPIHS